MAGWGTRDEWSTLIGREVGPFLFARMLEKRGDGGRRYGVFVCRNGREHAYPVGRVVNGAIATCCCFWQSAARTHGMWGTPEYDTWGWIKERCCNTAGRDYQKYGAVGITMCEEWKASFDAFFHDVGPKPPGTSIDRIDNTRGYEPGNVRWATPSEQASNRRNSWIVCIDGDMFSSVADAARSRGVSESTVVRWCDGFVDKRRHTGWVPPRTGCWRKKRYGEA